MSEPLHDDAATPSWLVGSVGHVPLRLPEVRVLKALAGVKGPLTRRQISHEANIGPTTVHSGLWGREAGKSHESTSYPGLIARKHAEEVTSGTGGQPQKAYRLTDAGRHALAAYEAQHGTDLPLVRPGPPKAQGHEQAPSPQQPAAADPGGPSAEETARIKEHADADQFNGGACVFTDKDPDEAGTRGVGGGRRRFEASDKQDKFVGGADEAAAISRMLQHGKDTGVSWDDDGYITYIGPKVAFDELKTLFPNGPVLRKMPDGEIVEVVASADGRPDLADPAGAGRNEVTTMQPQQPRDKDGLTPEEAEARIRERSSAEARFTHGEYTVTDKDGNKVDPDRHTGGGGDTVEDGLAGLILRDTDGYVTYTGPWVTMDDLKKLFKGGPVLRKMPDGTVWEIVGIGTGEDV